MAMRSAESTPSVKSACAASAFAAPMRPSLVDQRHVRKSAADTTLIRQAMPAPSLLPAKCRQVLPAPATTGLRARARARQAWRGSSAARCKNGFFASAGVQLTETLRQIARLGGSL